MRQSYRIIPIYTADVSGVCSALYELGGMVVMHDPSGCNSTYNTHDEIRWYEQDSLIFISGLSEMDAIFGNDEKFLNDMKRAAEEFHPKFIALAGSPIPYMNGTDFPALAQILEEETGIPSFAVPTNGMHDYVYGAGIALEEIARHFVKTADNRGATDNKRIQEAGTGDSEPDKKKKVNLLGVTPLDFGPIENVRKMKQNLEQYGWEIGSTWAMGDAIEQLSCAGESSVNLVVSSVGLRTAKLLWEKFGTPYVIGTPIQGYEERIHAALESAIEEQKSGLVSYLEDRKKTCSGNSGKVRPEVITVIGEPVQSGSLAAMIGQKSHNKVRVLCPLQEAEGLLAPEDRAVRGEEEMEEALRDADIIVADPLYRPICPKEAKFYELPHIAFSGRIFLNHWFKKTIF